MIKVSAPGRADLLNTHQDYKGLPVVPAAIKLRTYVSGVVREDNVIKVCSSAPDIEPQCDEFKIDDLVFTNVWSDYVKATIRAILGIVKRIIRGAELRIESDVPIGAGLGSSAALIVSILKWFNEAYDLNLDKKSIAELAFTAEHHILGIPCGRLDQYSSTYGWIIVLNTKYPFSVEYLPMKNLVFVIVDSGEKHSTKIVHSERQRELREALSKLLELELPRNLKNILSTNIDEVKWEELRLKILNRYLDDLPQYLSNRIKFTILMNKSTELGIKVLKHEKVSIENLLRLEGMESIVRGRKLNSLLHMLGAIMDYQHMLLRDLYDVSTPHLENIRNSMIEAGALGVKISGAGMGGSLIALVKNFDHGKKVLKYALRAGVINGWILELDEGVRRD